MKRHLLSIVLIVTLLTAPGMAQQTSSASATSEQTPLQSPSTAGPYYTVTDLGTLGGAVSKAYGINDKGQVVGSSYISGGERAFLWEEGTMQNLGSLGGDSWAYDINNAGQVVGMSFTASWSQRAFLWANGTMQDLGTLGGCCGYAYGINDAGQVVGEAVVDDNNEIVRAFLWQNGSMQNLGSPAGGLSRAKGINNTAQVVGEYSDNLNQGTYAFFWQNGSYQDLGLAFGIANAINNAGQVVGESTEAFLWQNGAIQYLGTLGSGPRSIAYDINDAGLVVGMSYIQAQGGASHAFLWENGQMKDLNTLIPADAGWELREARGINKRGQIVGWGTHNGQTHAFLLTPRLPWTLMFYLDGDNNLDYTYPAIIQQLQNAATNPNVNIVALWDSVGFGNSVYYKFKAGGVDDTPQGELNMSDPTTLADFVNWARTDYHYPAQHYALLLDNHGSGVTGGLVDTWSSFSARMSVPQLGAALSTATSGGTKKIDVLVMNMCLMGMIEDAYEVRGYVDYYVASENGQWAYSTGYHTYASGIISTTTPAQFATAVVNGYANDVSSRSHTMSAADISQLGNLVNATNSLALLLTNQITTTAPILTNVSQAVQRYDNKAPMGTINTADQYIDLYDFARLVKAGATEAGIQNAAQGVMDAVTSYIIAERHNSVAGSYDLSGSHGVSIFFPSISGSFYTGLNLSFAAGTNWGRSSLLQASDATNAWGPLLVRYFAVAQPGGPDDPNLPEPVSRLVEYRHLYLPLLMR